jgi:hypothetical protein
MCGPGNFGSLRYKAVVAVALRGSPGRKEPGEHLRVTEIAERLRQRAVGSEMSEPHEVQIVDYH